ncbi:hypothetical protein Y032_0011g1423 [Ancylostoma ceylanicum]|uniref:Uncharacterized protein n=1 Tax=Ancylostoma ceylanicum TaxID=53326 RepID=A0A016VGG9_9BILA|nr:hypothetical protein Y032_0011g1423 [Ancylostoma ceylanicum]
MFADVVSHGYEITNPNPRNSPFKRYNALGVRVLCWWVYCNFIIAVFGSSSLHLNDAHSPRSFIYPC